MANQVYGSIPSNLVVPPGQTVAAKADGWESVTPGAPVGLSYNVKAYGAQGDGSNDDTVAIQTAIDAAQLVHGSVFLPTGLYKITAALVIDEPITFYGDGIAAHYGSIDAAESRIIGVEIPTLSPYLYGSVLLQTTAATNAIEINVMGESVNLRNFGIRFSDAIRFQNTGHGIYALPPLNEADQLPDFGLFDSSFENIFVWGHDGNHYAFSLVNMVLCTFTNLRGFGGGGLEMYANTNMTSPGNCVNVHPYFAQFVGGTAHGIYIHASGNTLGCILNTFIRPQVNWLEGPTAWNLTAIDIDVQHFFYADNHSLKLCLINPDFETMIGGTAVLDPRMDGFCLIPNGGGGQTYTYFPYASFLEDGMRLYKDANPNVQAALYFDGVVIQSPDEHLQEITVNNSGEVSKASDVNPTGTSIAAALAGKLSTSGVAADVNVAGTNIAAALAGKQAAGTYLTSANIEDSIVDGHTTIAPSNNAVFDALALKLATNGTAADVNVAGTNIAAALSGKLGTGGTAADVNPAGTSIATALAGKLATGGTAADVNPAGTSIAASLAGKANSTHTHAEADVTNLTTDLGNKQATLVSGTNIKTINGSTVLGSGDLIVTGSLPEMVVTRQTITTNTTIAVGYSAFVIGPFELPAGSDLEIAGDFEIG